MEPLPHDVYTAMELLKVNYAQEFDGDALAAACGVGRRTLEKHFRRFLGRTLAEVRRDLCMEQARRDLLRNAPDASVTEIALHCGFKHLGRFAALYRASYGESPSDTLRRFRRVAATKSNLPIRFPLSLDRPTVGVHSFDFIGTSTIALAAIREEILA